MLWARLRIWTGLILAAFVLTHLSNHALGLASIEVMEAARKLNALVWHSLPGSIALYGALGLHLVVALRTLYIRRSLRLAPWELAQLTLGLVVPLLIMAHVLGTRVNSTFNGFDVGYPFVLNALWTNDWYRIKQALLVGAVWLHLCVGLHYWWRNKPWYRPLLPWLYAVALIVPTVSLLGYVRASVDLQSAFAATPGLKAEVLRGWIDAPAANKALLIKASNWLPWVYLGLIAALLSLRWLRRRKASARASIRLEHPERPVSARPGQTVLEALRAAGIAHASTCGGRARCTTCRIRIAPGSTQLPAAESLEAQALLRIQAPEGVRLACQLRPQTNLSFTPLVAVKGQAERNTPGGVYGRERKVVAMFVDLRGSTALNEARLPYDVVFILNQFFAEMSAALRETDGHYAQFAGDGLMALYGMKTDLSTACRQALQGAAQMERRLSALNARLVGELPEPLRIGIGIHCGEAIVGTMGPPSSPNLSAIGDNINIAARLEGLTKTYGATLVVSVATLENAGVDASAWPLHEAPVRGRQEAVSVRAVDSASTLAQAGLGSVATAQTVPSPASAG